MPGSYPTGKHKLCERCKKNRFYQRVHTRRKYCDDCKEEIDRSKLERHLASLESRGLRK